MAVAEFRLKLAQRETFNLVLHYNQLDGLILGKTLVALWRLDQRSMRGLSGRDNGRQDWHNAGGDREKCREQAYFQEVESIELYEECRGRWEVRSVVKDASKILA
jgi:hypothetical protein